MVISYGYLDKLDNYRVWEFNKVEPERWAERPCLVSKSVNWVPSYYLNYRHSWLVTASPGGEGFITTEMFRILLEFPSHHRAGVPPRPGNLDSLCTTKTWGQLNFFFFKVEYWIWMGPNEKQALHKEIHNDLCTTGLQGSRCTKVPGSLV